MWLLNPTEIKLTDYVLPENRGLWGKEVLPYAILSHTWEDEEVLFQDIHKPTSKGLKGYSKIKQCCALARAMRLDAVWVDTCCINKSSSAELSEAINSMYTWYRRSLVCYVYLSDFSFSTGEHDPKAVLSPTFVDKFKKCRWFRRGWTLQELLAPFNVEFYDKHWHYIGDKVDLARQISTATGIDQQYITEWNSISKASVAARMSWASERETTRIEDRAYCLMGLFGVNMPLLYGEGHNAFLRLQHEIARNSDDESLFAWHRRRSDVGGLESGIFSDRPEFFAGCGHFVPIPNPAIERTPYTITNKGLAIMGDYLELRSPDVNGPFGFSKKDDYCEYLLFPLQCVSEKNSEHPFTIILKKISRHKYVRFLSSEESVYEKYAPHIKDTQRETVYIQHPPYNSNVAYFDENEPPLEMYSSALLTPQHINRHQYALKDWHVSATSYVVPSSYDWEIRLGTFLGTLGYAILLFKHVSGDPLIIILKFGCPTEGKIQVVLDARADGATFHQTVDAYKGNFQLIGTIPDDKEYQEIQINDGTIVRLVRFARPHGWDRLVLGIMASP
ncbi:MAG: hypothetical protein Q9209_007944 [Squamulea sp. 1 TL-2023]